MDNNKTAESNKSKKKREIAEELERELPTQEELQEQLAATLQEQQEIAKVAQEIVAKVEAEASQEPEDQPEDAPVPSRVIVTFAGPESAHIESLSVEGQVSPNQIALAGMHMINQAESIWNAPFIEMIVQQVIAEFFQQQKKAQQEKQVRELLGRRGGNLN